jgi:peptide/nickel transport system substrate-binding protein
MSAKPPQRIGPLLDRRHFLKLSAASAASMLAPLARPRSSWSAEDNILRIRSYQDVAILDPCCRIGPAEEDIMHLIANNLTSMKPGNTWEWELEAAESIEQVDPTHIKFTLRPGIMYTDGFGEMTAGDVKFSFERFSDPELQSPNADDWKALDRVDVTGKYSGVIVLKSPFQPLWTNTLPMGSGAIISQKAVESVGGSFKTQPPCSSGPYVIKEWIPKQRTVLVRNALWNGPRTDFDEIHIFPIDDEKTAEIAFEAGDIDFTRISASSYKMFHANPPANSTVASFPSLDYIWVGMNADHPLLKDIRVRRAIQMAVDVPSILEAAYFGLAEPATGIIPPGLTGHRPQNIVPIEANPEAARKLLAEAGYPDGLAVTLDILNTSTFTTAAQVIQASLAEAGIQVQVNSNESGNYWSLGIEAEGDRWKNLQLWLGYYMSNPDPFYATQWFTPQQVGIWNWERFNSPEFGELHDMAIKETDPMKRDTMYRRMQDLMEESGCYRFITHGLTPIVYRNTIVPALRPDGLALLRQFKKA